MHLIKGSQSALPPPYAYDQYITLRWKRNDNKKYRKQMQKWTFRGEYHSVIMEENDLAVIG